MYLWSGLRSEKGAKKMCKYQSIRSGRRNHPQIICTYTKALCTYCIYANSDTYIKAKEQEAARGGKQHRDKRRA